MGRKSQAGQGHLQDHHRHQHPGHGSEGRHAGYGYPSAQHRLCRGGTGFHRSAGHHEAGAGPVPQQQRQALYEYFRSHRKFAQIASFNDYNMYRKNIPVTKWLREADDIQFQKMFEL